MHRTGKRGLGRSYLDGMRAALETDAEVVFQMDADLCTIRNTCPTSCAPRPTTTSSSARGICRA
jgi:hypothetical protein